MHHRPSLQGRRTLHAFLILGTAFCLLSWVLATVALGARAFFAATCDVPRVHTMNEPSTWLHDQFSCQDLRHSVSGDEGTGSVKAAWVAVVKSANAQIAGMPLLLWPFCSIRSSDL